jgi:hypothetical protein
MPKSTTPRRGKAKPAKRRRAGRGRAPEEIYCRCTSNNVERRRALGLRARDSFTVSRPATDPKQGQTIILVSEKGWSAGRFVGFEPFRGGPGMALDLPGGCEWVIDLCEWNPYHFDDSTIKHAPHPNAARLAELRRRLRRLTDDHDEDWNTTRRFDSDDSRGLKRVARKKCATFGPPGSSFMPARAAVG